MTERKIQWKKTVTRPLSPLKATALMDGLDRGIASVLGVSLKNHLIEPVGDKHAWYVDGSEWGSFVKVLSERAKDIQYLEARASEAYEVCETLKTFALKVHTYDHSKMSGKEIESLVHGYHKALYRYPFVAWGMLVMEQVLAEKLREYLKVLLSQKGEASKLEEYFEILTTKVDWIDAEKEELELLEIRSKADSMNKTELEDALRKHTQEYGWLPMYDHNIPPWGEEYFEDKLNQLPENAGEELQKRVSTLERRKKKIEEILKDLNDEELSRIVHLVEKYILLRTYRTDTLRIVYYNIDPLLQEIGKRMGLENREIAYLSIDEVINFLRGGAAVPREEVMRRMKHVLIIKIGDKIKIESSKANITRILTEHLATDSVRGTLKGVGVYPGLVRGPVRVIESLKDQDRIQPGDILVTTMTTPEMHEMLGKVAAIITDEGGMTCHAAIVSRELQIPCVIATENATKLLKTGEIVEVNSKNGTVRKVKE